MIHVLEHVLNPVEALSRAVSTLSEDGFIYVEVPDLLSDRWLGKDFFHVAHVSYFHEIALRNLFLRCGLQVDAVIRGAAEIWPWAIGFLGRKGSTSIDRFDQVPTVPRAFIDRIKRHVASRLGARRPGYFWFA
jgi:hypothetical protein